MKMVFALFTACMFAAICSSTAVAQTGILPSPGLNVPGYGPGIAGQIVVGPTAPVCRPEIPCTRPFAGARVEILDNLRRLVASAISNKSGNFIVSVPSGDYIVHVQVVDFPRCEEANVTVGPSLFVLAAIECDTGIR
jgi:hypothetical protein